jgi:hypothetical protein
MDYGLPGGVAGAEDEHVLSGHGWRLGDPAAVVHPGSEERLDAG